MAQPGTLYRAAMKFERDFTQLPNQWLRDERLSRGARGILGELMTHRAGYSISITGLVERGREGKDAVRRMVSELEACGYLRRDKQSRKAGQFGGMRWTLMDPWDALVPPPTVGGFSADGKTADGLPADGSPVAGEPATKNTKLNNNLNRDFPAQPSVVSAEPVDNSGKAVCGHAVNPGTDRCYLSCQREFELRSAS